jgi:nucleoside-diphosphate-sugar epimerase
VQVRHLLATIKPEVIFHLAGQSTAAPNLELILPTFRSLLVSTVNLITIATEVGCNRIVLIGSLSEPNHADLCGRLRDRLGVRNPETCLYYCAAICPTC